MGDLGTLRLSLSSEGKMAEEEVNDKAIKSARIIYRPGECHERFKGIFFLFNELIDNQFVMDCMHP